MEKQSPCFELEEVHVGTTAEEDERLLDLQIRIAYHLRLNASGRRRLLRDYGFVPKDVLVDVLGNCSDNVPCLYYFLKLNPEIVDAH
ncbi:expressed unknown protein [Seminavis robusta]|nr:expressed unknown protein [Seminavis robusta]|eukprot:Sro184_g080160.1 n/a (87) ;mRNA; r:95252-95512